MCFLAQDRNVNRGDNVTDQTALESLRCGFGHSLLAGAGIPFVLLIAVCALFTHD